MLYQSFIYSTLQSAAKIAQQNFGKVKGATKPEDNNQVLTQTDLDIGQFIISEIQKQFPTHNIIDEEVGVIDNHSEYTWVIDPIDGTSNFAAGVPTYGVMLGLLKNDLPVAGGVALPAFHDIYAAEKKNGIQKNGETFKARVSTDELAKVLFAYGIDSKPHQQEKTKAEAQLIGELVMHFRNLRASNSVFDVVMLLEGGYGVVLNQNSKIWDNVAQQILVEECGAKYTDFWGKPISYSDKFNIEKNYTFCTAHTKIHDQVQCIISKNSL